MGLSRIQVQSRYIKESYPLPIYSRSDLYTASLSGFLVVFCPSVLLPTAIENPAMAAMAARWRGRHHETQLATGAVSAPMLVATVSVATV